MDKSETMERDSETMDAWRMSTEDAELSHARKLLKLRKHADACPARLHNSRGMQALRVRIASEEYFLANPHDDAALATCSNARKVERQVSSIAIPARAPQRRAAPALARRRAARRALPASRRLIAPHGPTSARARAPVAVRSSRGSCRRRCAPSTGRACATSRPTRAT